MRSHLLNDTTAETYRRSVTEGIERVAAKLATTSRPFTGVTVDALSRIDEIDLDKPLLDTTAVLDELEDVYLRDAIYFHHPRYLAHLNCPVVIPAVLGEAILSAVNSSLDTWDQSAGGTLIERKLIDWTTARIGLGPVADGVFTSGGTQSNLQALLLAREEAKADSSAKLRVFASEVSHFSVKKSAKLLGLGADSVVSIPARRRQADADRRPAPGQGPPGVRLRTATSTWPHLRDRRAPAEASSCRTPASTPTASPAPTWAWAPTATAASSGSCSAPSTTRSRRRSRSRSSPV